MDELADAPGTKRPGIEHLVAERFEHRLGALEDSLVAANHYFMNAACGAGLARSDRRIENMRALFAKQGCQPANERRRAGRDVDVDGAGSDSFDDTRGAAGDLL